MLGKVLGVASCTQATTVVVVVAQLPSATGSCHHALAVDAVIAHLTSAKFVGAMSNRMNYKCL